MSWVSREEAEDSKVQCSREIRRRVTFITRLPFVCYGEPRKKNTVDSELEFGIGEGEGQASQRAGIVGVLVIQCGAWYLTKRKRFSLYLRPEAASVAVPCAPQRQ